MQPSLPRIDLRLKNMMTEYTFIFRRRRLKGPLVIYAVDLEFKDVSTEKVKCPTIFHAYQLVPFLVYRARHTSHTMGPVRCHSISNILVSVTGTRAQRAPYTLNPKFWYNTRGTRTIMTSRTVSSTLQPSCEVCTARAPRCNPTSLFCCCCVPPASPRRP